MPDSLPALASLRDQVDAVDRRLVEALAERQRLVAAVAMAKAADDALPLHDPRREADLLARVHTLAEDEGVDGYFAETLYRQILRHSVRFQAARQPDATGGERPLRVVYQGEPGCYSYAAARAHFGATGGVEAEGTRTFADAIEALRRGEADRAVLPVENTTAGPIAGVYDLLLEPGLQIVGEEVVHVEHCLLALEAVPLGRIRRIGSHPQALVQCSQFLAGLDGVHVEAEDDTAGAAAAVAASGDLSRAAIAGEDAAARYGLVVVKRHVANRKENYTRFVVVARGEAAPDASSGDPRLAHKTSFLLTVDHRQGALAEVLQAFAQADVNLTKLESRPSQTHPWQYAFYVDVEGGLHEAPVREAVAAAERHAGRLRVLGSYPAFHAGTSRAVARSHGPAAEAAPTRRAAPAVHTSRATLVDRAGRPDTIVEVTGGDGVVVRVGGGAPPVLIAGPCSVESREQIFESARGVRAAGAAMLRGGCFKPRTLPYDFQGMGFEGLAILHEAGRAHGLPVVTEVLHPADVEAVAREADVLQIGARNMQNFELLKAVGAVRTPVLLKRGMMASIDEWLAAAEYVLAGGNDRLILCERGIRTFETATRNTLDLSAVIVARERTHLPVIVDPSHAAGVRRWVPALSHAALAAGAHGLIVEAHPDPEVALSDGPQSLTLPGLATMAHDLGLRQTSAEA